MKKPSGTIVSMTELIYTMRFADGSTYIGATRNFKARRQNHRRNLRKGRGVNEKVRKKFQKFGKPTFEVCAEPLPGQSLRALEEQVIATQEPELNVVTVSVVLPDNSVERARAWGPFDTQREAAVVLGVGYNTAKRWSAKTSYEDWLTQQMTATRKAPELAGPPNPSGNPWYVFARGTWYRKEDRRATLGLSADTVQDRRRRGWSDERIFTTPPEDQEMKKRVIECAGETLTVTEWARRAGVRPGTIHNRLRRGWTPEQVVGLAPPPSEDKWAPARKRKAERAARREAARVRHGDFVGTVREAAQRFGLNYATLLYRLNAEWPIGQALGLEPRAV